MTRYVLDASVAVKWYLSAERESLIEEARRLLTLYVAGQTDFLVPDLFFTECANIFRKAERQNRCSPAASGRALVALLAARFSTFPSTLLLATALQIAREYNRSFYDSLYLSLALEWDALLVTADERLVHAVGADLPVVWLGAMSESSAGL